MLKTVIQLPDGTELSSGAGQTNVIQSFTATECVNAEQELTVGSCCSNMVEITLLTPGGGVNIAAGDEITVYQIDEVGTQHLVGLFTAEKPTRQSANITNVTCYDRISWLDKDLTNWLVSLNDWPYTLYDLAVITCEKCGLSLLNSRESMLNGEYLVKKFTGEGITGRNIMQWIGQICGNFCRATKDGNIEFAWYTALDTTSVGPKPGATYEENTAVLGKAVLGKMVLGSSGTNETVIMYFQKGLSFENYTTACIERVQLKQSEQDVGTVYPADLLEEANTYIIQSNPLLTSSSGDALVSVAQNLYEHLKDVSYTPMTVTIPANLAIRAGHILDIEDINGRRITTYVMSRSVKGQKVTLSCTGSPNLNSVTAVNNKTFADLNGKVFNLRMDVDGLKVENSGNAGNIASLALDVSGIEGRVTAQETKNGSIEEDISVLKQSAEDVQISIQKVIDDGVSKVKTEMGYTFDDEGLKIQRNGQQMSNLLNERGMYVKRSDDVILQADASGVIATDVTVNNYLIVGEHARFEDYTNGTDSKRTACFYI